MDGQVFYGTILVVDDEAKVVHFINGVFTPRGYQVLTAMSGDEALKLVDELYDEINLVLLDLRMPGLDGIEVLKTIKKKHPEISVGILTAYEERKADCMKNNADFFVAKPYSLRDLYERVEEIVKKRQRPKEEKVEIKPGYIPVAKILVVDDEKDLCDELKETLESGVEAALGEYRVEVAYEGNEGLKKAREFEPDIMIVDIKMPHLRGDRLISILEAEGPRPKDYVILTAIDGEEEKRSFRRSGYAYVSKPFDLDKFFEGLRRLCFKHDLIRKL